MMTDSFFSIKSLHDRETHTPNPAKLSFSSKLGMEGGSALARSNPSLEERDLASNIINWVGKKALSIFPGNGLNNSSTLYLDVSLPEDLDIGIALDKQAESVRIRTEKLYEVKEGIIETAQKARVPVPSAKLPYIGYIHSLTIKNLLCGVLAGAVASTLAVPFDIVKTRAIAGQGGRTAAQVVSTVAHEEGLQTLMKGSLKFNIVKNAVEKGLQFTTFEFVKRYQERQTGEQKKVFPLPRQIPVATAGGAAAGLIGTLLSYPLQPVFDRIILQPDKYKSLQGTLKQIIRHEGGIRELYRGITPALIAIVPNAALSFYSYDTLKKHLRLSKDSRPALDALQSLIVGGLAGAISTSITYPLEEARKQILLSSLSPKAVHLAEGGARVYYKNTWHALNGIVKKEGWHGLYRGLTSQNLQIVPVTAATFMVYELAKRAFVAYGEERRDEVKDVQDIED